MKRLILLSLLLSATALAGKVYWTAPDYQTAHVYASGTFIRPSAGNAGGFSYMATDGGTSLGAAPTWCQLPNCATAETGASGQVYWVQRPLEKIVYCPNGATKPQFCTPSSAAGASSLTFSANIFSTAAIGATINLYGDGAGSVLTGGTVVTACTSCIVNLPSVVLPVTSGTKAYHTVRAQSVETGAITGSADQTFLVDYLASGGGTNYGMIVSLTFDDTFREQYTTIAPLLELYGMRGTFFINAQRALGNVNGGLGFGAGYMTMGMVQDLQRRGHEIGDHTISHLNLPCLSSATQHIEIGNNTALLRQNGLTPLNTAYPFGAEQIPQTWTVDQDVGLGGRDIGGFNNAKGYCGSSASGVSAPYGNQIPPKLPFDYSAEPSLSPDCHLADFQNYILDAADAGNVGWVILNAHHLCPFLVDAGGCDPTLYPSPTLSTPLPDYQIFIPWLANLADAGIFVQRIEDVTGNAYAPYTTWPNLTVKNGSVEDYSNNGAACLASQPAAPDCFFQSTTGSSNAVFTWAIQDGGAHSGNFAYKLNITNSPTQGTVRMVTSTQPNPMPIPQDVYCPIPLVQPGTLNTVCVWYQSTNTVDLVVYNYHTDPPGTGTWTLTKSLNGIAASPGVWAQACFQTPVSGTGSVIDAGVNSYPGGTPISFGLSDSTTGSVSSVLTDDYTITTP